MGIKYCHTMPLDFLDGLINMQVDPEELTKNISEDDEALILARKDRKPIVEVSLYRLEPGKTEQSFLAFFPSLDELCKRLSDIPAEEIAQAEHLLEIEPLAEQQRCEGRPMGLLPVHYKLIGQRHLYDLSDIGRSDVLSAGRYLTNDFNFWLTGDHTDKNNQDTYTSREHSLIILKGHSVYYYDRGTLITPDMSEHEKKDADSHTVAPREVGKRHGSRAGSYWNNDRRNGMQDLAIEWHEKDTINMGQEFYSPTAPNQSVFQFEFRYKSFSPLNGTQQTTRPIGGMGQN